MSTILIVLSAADTWTRADGSEYESGVWAEEFVVMDEAFIAAGCTVDIVTPGRRAAHNRPAQHEPRRGRAGRCRPFPHLPGRDRRPVGAAARAFVPFALLMGAFGAGGLGCLFGALRAFLDEAGLAGRLMAQSRPIPAQVSPAPTFPT